MKIRELTAKGKLLTDAYDIELLLRNGGFGWVLDAETENAVLEIIDRKLYWYAGQWYAGTWQDGVWLNGSFRAGQWLNGVWHNGTFQGTWNNGTWVRGTFRGTWKSPKPSPLTENIIISFDSYHSG